MFSLRKIGTHFKMTSLKESNDLYFDDLLDYNSDSPARNFEKDQKNPEAAQGERLPETMESDDGWNSPTESVGRKYVPPVRTSGKKTKTGVEDSDEEEENTVRTVRPLTKEPKIYTKLDAIHQRNSQTHFDVTLNGSSADREKDRRYSNEKRRSTKWKNAKRKFESYGL